MQGICLAGKAYMKDLELSDAQDGMQSIGQLWQSIHALARHVDADNELAKKYPTHIRINQLNTIKTLVAELEKHHNGEAEAPKPLGFADAVRALQSDANLELFECEVGRFDNEDPCTAFDTHTVLIAGTNPDEAMNEAVDYVQDVIGVDSCQFVGSMTDANPVEPRDYGIKPV